MTVKVCTPGSQSACASIDHVLLDTGSWGLRLVRSVLTAAAVTLTAETDAQGNSIEECLSFSGGQTWGPVAPADVTLAGETAANLPVQVMDDTGAGAAPPATCGANGTLINGVAGFDANGVLGVGVFAQDCGAACVSAASPLPLYYGCTAAGVCTAENVALAQQVTNPVALFASDNNGISINLPNLINANGDASVQGELIFGIGTQSDNALPAGLTVLGADASGDFTATYNGSATVLPALIDSGTDSYAFDDPTIAVCSSGAFIGYYCPAVAPQSLFTVNTGVGANTATNTVNFALADPNTFVRHRGRLHESRRRRRIDQLHLGYAVLLRPHDLYRDRPARRRGLYRSLLRLLTGGRSAAAVGAVALRSRPSALAGQFLRDRGEAAAGGNVARGNPGAIAQARVRAGRQQEVADVHEAAAARRDQCGVAGLVLQIRARASGRAALGRRRHDRSPPRS